MERKLAELVVKNFQRYHGQTLSIEEAMSMTKVMSDERDVYAIQKGKSTYLAWISTSTMTCMLRTEIVSW